MYRYCCGICMQSHVRVSVFGLFCVIIAVVLLETFIFSACTLWTLPNPSDRGSSSVWQHKPADDLAGSVTRSSNMHGILLTALALLVGSAIDGSTAQPAPIPNRPPGFPYKPNESSCDAPVQLESWVDLICPDSQRAWLTYQKVADYYGPENLRFSALMFPLPYHRAAMLASQGSFVADSLDSNLTYAWFNNVFEKQAALSDTTIYDQPESYIVDTLSGWAAEVGYDEATFKSLLARGDPNHGAARIEFKYGCSRGVYGTPQTYINGALVFADPSWTLDDWKEVIDPLLSRNRYLYRH